MNILNLASLIISGLSVLIWIFRPRVKEFTPEEETEIIEEGSVYT